MTPALLCALLLTLAPSPPAKGADEAPAAERAGALLEVLGDGARSAEDRLAAARELAEIEPLPLQALEAFLARERRSSEEERRRVLGAIKAEVPDAQGRFPSLGRRLDPEEQQQQDEFDWLAALAKIDSKTAAASEVFADTAAIRALADSRRPAAAAVILQFAFTGTGLVYRDECGRRLRAMSPYSLPALIRGAEDTRHDASLRRYANYQLERLDRESPFKAMRDAVSDELKISILRAFAEVRHREAIYAVLEHVDHHSPRVREAAREAWMVYAESKPRPVPRRRLGLPGGKQTSKAMPLWLDHLELQDIAVRRALEEIGGKKPSPKSELQAMSKELFALQDQRRTRALEHDFDQALAEAAAGRAEQAAAAIDQVLVQAPDFHRKKEAAPVYAGAGEALEKQEKWREAAIAYAKAHSTDPDGPLARKALGQHHFARGKAVEAEGGDASDEFARALEVDPEHGSLRDGIARSGWMLYAGIAGGAFGLLLLLLGLALRRK